MMKKFLRYLALPLLLVASNAWAAFESGSAYVVVKSTSGVIYFFQEGLYYNATSPNAEVTAATVGALTPQFSAVSPSGSVSISGTAHDAAAAAVAPILTGCYGSAAAPSDVSATNDAVRDWCLLNGARAVQITASGTLVSPLTDTQLRATAVPVSGTVTANVGTGTQAISAASASIASGAVASGAFASGSVASGAFASGALASGSVASGAMVDLGLIADSAATAGSTGTVSAKLRTMTAQLDTLNTTMTGVAHDASGTSTNPALVGGYASAAAPSDVSGDGDAVRAWHLRNGAQAVTPTFAGVLPSTGVGASDTGTQRVATAAYASSAAVSLTRTADTNVYAANDIIGAATGSTAALTFTSMCPVSAANVMLTTVALEIDAASVISGETSYRLYLYNVTPPSALGDNAAFNLPSGDRASFLGYVDLGTVVDLGDTLYVQTTGVNKQLKCAGTSLFGYLVTVGTYTPTSARVHVITLNAVGL